jgi:hypothetical protein
LVSPGVRFPAVESKATNRPSALIDGLALSRLACPPEVETLTRSVSPVTASCTKMSARRLVSFGTRLVASESKAVKRALSLMAGRLNRPLMLFPSVPLLATLVRIVTEEGVAPAPNGHPITKAVATMAISHDLPIRRMDFIATSPRVGGIKVLDAWKRRSKTKVSGR